MKVVIQRVENANVVIDNSVYNSIDYGLMILLGISKNDSIEDIKYLINKIINLRIFKKNNKMDLSVKDINGEILLISQFTLYADTRRGNRPSFTNSLSYEEALKLYDCFIKELTKEHIKFKTGKFGENMKISLVNDGPVTIIIDSKER